MRSRTGATSSLSDFERGLERARAAGAALMGEHIREHGVKFDTIVASPAERVKLTLEAGRIGVPIRWEQNAYLADSDALITLLRQAPRTIRTRCCSPRHNPGLQELIFATGAARRRERAVRRSGREIPDRDASRCSNWRSRAGPIAPEGCGEAGPLRAPARPRSRAGPRARPLTLGGLQAACAISRARPMFTSRNIITTPKPTRTRGAVAVVSA